MRTSAEQREEPIAVKQWGGQLSNLPLEVIPLNGFRKLLNMAFTGPNTLRSRSGTSEWMNNNVTGSSSIIAGFEFKRSSDPTSKLLFVNGAGQLYSRDVTGGAPVLIDTLTNTSPINVSMVQMKDCLWIADGIDFYKYDGTNLTVETSELVSAGMTGNPVYVAKARNQVWVGSDDDYVYASVYNNPDDFQTTANGAYKVEVGGGDGCVITSIVPWDSTLIINKVDSERDHHKMFWIRGLNTTADPYRLESMFGDEKAPTSFVGNSGIAIQNDVIGLTLDGFVSVSAIENFREAASGVISFPVHDVVQRINFSRPEQIQAVYDTVDRMYMCAVPLDGAITCNAVFVYDVRGDRWTFYDNWDVRCWVRVGSDVLFGTNNGRFVRTRTGDSDEGSGFNKVLETGDIDMNYPGVVKLFKSIEFKLRHEGTYSIDYQYYLDGVLVTPTPIEIDVIVESGSFWDIFHWDIDEWDILDQTDINVLQLGRGKTIRHKLSNSNADEPFTLQAMIHRIVTKDSGPNVP